MLIVLLLLRVITCSESERDVLTGKSAYSRSFSAAKGLYIELLKIKTCMRSFHSEVLHLSAGIEVADINTHTCQLKFIIVYNYSLLRRQ